MRRSDCDLSLNKVRFDAVAVQAGPAGSTMVADALPDADRADAVSLTIHTLGDGNFEVVQDSEPITTIGGADPGNECTDSTQGVATAYKVRNVLNWGFRSGTAPASVGVTNSVNAVTDALNNMRTGANRCTFIRQPNPPGMSYTGVTATGSNIASDGSCGVLDASHIVDFGVLPSRYAGLTCYSYDGAGTLLHFDMRLSSLLDWDYTLTDGCYNNDAYDVASVATHEWGHVYGVSHVDEASHGALTMSTAINGPCQTSERTLGSGDVNHMIAKYGTL